MCLQCMWGKRPLNGARQEPPQVRWLRGSSPEAQVFRVVGRTRDVELMSGIVLGDASLSRKRTTIVYQYPRFRRVTDEIARCFRSLRRAWIWVTDFARV